MDRKIIGVAGVYVGAYVRTDEEPLVEEDALIAGLAVRGGTLGMEMVEMDVFDFACVGPPAEGFDQHVGHARDAAEVDMVSGPDGPDRFICTDVSDFFHGDAYR